VSFSTTSKMRRFPISLHEDALTLIFGSQDLDINETSAKNLRATLLETPSLQWILDTLTKLPQHWQTISETNSVLRDFPGQKHLEGLIGWLRKGIFTDESPLPNIIVTPLVVITHLVQYSAFVKQLHPGIAPDDSLQTALKLPAETIGLCTGLLSSAAVASSATLAQLETYGAVAIRMAMAIGALVDATDTDPWKSVVVGWVSSDAGEKLARVLKDFPKVWCLRRPYPYTIS
jgi:Starter unit:ACP transacylase in aflatoxin biosynthesis